MNAAQIILAVSSQAFPLEACGLVLRGGGVVVGKNRSTNPLVSFHLDDKTASLVHTGLVTAVWHSHPNAGPEPSEDDERWAVSGLEYWIYSVPQRELGKYRLAPSGGLSLILLEEH